MKFLSILLLFPLLAVTQESPSDRFYTAIRQNDVTALVALIKEHGPDADSRRQTPLMLASGFGSLEALQTLVYAGADVKAASAAGLTALHLAAGDPLKVRLLVDRGAAVDARSQMGRTPLLVAAYTTGAAESIRYLLSRGADANAGDAQGFTPLLAAISVNDEAAIRLLLERGADVHVRANSQVPATALLAAAHNGNTGIARLLLERKVSVKEVAAAPGARVLNGVVQFGSYTALHSAALSGHTDIAGMLLDAGAPVDAEDARGMTPLMWSIATDRPAPAIVRMLLAKGADVSRRSTAGESAVDWARKFNNPAVLAELKLKPVAAAESSPSARPRATTVLTARAAVERALPPLQESSANMLTRGGCIACHAQPVTHVAALLARDRGWNRDIGFLDDSLQILRTQWLTADPSLLQGNETGANPESLLYSAMALAQAGEPASWNTDVFVYFLLAKQRAEGYWQRVGASRAPIQDGRFSPTAMAIRTLAAYAIPARRAEIDDRIRRAADWLAAETPVSTEDRVMQLLGLKWSGGNARARESRVKELLALQRPDGGWPQTPYLTSDAYATGQTLYALRELGISPSETAMRRGVEYLVKTQHEDGSWHVPSRAMKIQPYFESGFPHDHDQWISSAATAWAVIGLSQAGSEAAVALDAQIPR